MSIFLKGSARKEFAGGTSLSKVLQAGKSGGKPFQNCLNRANHEKELSGLGFYHLRVLVPISPPAWHGLNPSARPWRGKITSGRSWNDSPALDLIHLSRGQIQKYYPEQKAVAVILIAHCREKKNKIPELQYINQFWFRGIKKNHHKPEKHPAPMASNQSCITRMDLLFIS